MASPRHSVEDPNMGDSSAKMVTCGGDPSKQWYVSFYQYDKAGRRRRRRKYVPRTITHPHDKWAYLVRLHASIEKILKEQGGTVGAAPRLSEALESVLEWKASHLRARSMDAYRGIVRHLLHYLDHPELLCTHFTETMARDFLQDITIQRKWKPKTYNLQLGYLRTLFDHLIEHKWIFENPFKAIKTLPETDAGLRHWSDVELRQYMGYCSRHDPTMYLVGQLIYKCALRPAEIRHLRIQNFDFENNIVWVDGMGSKNRKRQAITVPSSLLMDVQDYVAGYEKTRFLVGPGNEPGLKPLCRNYISYRFKVLRRRIGLPEHLHIYGLKHTGALAMDAMGLTPKEIQEQLRHHSLDQTDKYMRRILLRANEKILHW